MFELDHLSLLQKLIPPILSLFSFVLISGVFIALWKVGGRNLLSRLLHAISTLDYFIVRNVTYLIGTRRRRKISRWTNLLGVYFILAIGSFYSPTPINYAALLFSFVISYCVFRHWRYDEADRLIDIPEAERRIPAFNDLRNEAFFSLSLLFFFIPILIDHAQIHFSMFGDTTKYNEYSSALFLFSEILKALPLIDYSEIYNSGNISELKPISLAGKHINLFLRIILDVILIAGIFQLISLARKIELGHDLRNIDQALKHGNAKDVSMSITKLSDLAISAPTEIARKAKKRISDESINPRSEMGEIIADTLRKYGEKYSDDNSLFEAAETYRYEIEKIDKNKEIKKWVELNISLSETLIIFGRRRPDSRYLSEAVSRLTNVTRNPNRKLARNIIAHSIRTLGVAHALMAERTGKKEYLKLSMLSFEKALSYSPVDTDTECYATIHNNLGNTLRILWQFEHDPELLDKAIHSSQEALKYWPKEQHAEDWLKANINLGNALKDKAITYFDRSIAQEAVTVFCTVLSNVSRNEDSFLWAMSHNTAGNAYRVLGQFDKNPSILLQAISTYTEALKEWTRHKSPMDWAGIHLNMALTYLIIGKITGDIELFKRSELLSDNSKKEWSPQRHPHLYLMAAAIQGESRFHLSLKLNDKTYPEKMREELRILEGENFSSASSIEIARYKLRTTLAEVYTNKRQSSEHDLNKLIANIIELQKQSKDINNTLENFEIDLDLINVFISEANLYSNSKTISLIIETIMSLLEVPQRSRLAIAIKKSTLEYLSLLRSNELVSTVTARIIKNMNAITCNSDIILCNGQGEHPLKYLLIEQAGTVCPYCGQMYLNRDT